MSGSQHIKMGRGLELPTDAVARVMAHLGIRGSGKTYGAGKMVEGLLEHGGQVVILDPVGTWWGLRLAANGMGPGFDIPVFGGEHGDIPLEPGAGALVADVVIDRGISVVLDVSRFRKNERKRFVTEFGEQLFHRKKGKRSAVHLVLEEAQVFAPQRATGEERMLGAIEDLVRLGRNFGIGCTLISQRPQSVNKEVLNQAEALFLYRLAAAHERKAIQEWVVHHGADVGEMVSQLPSLETGEAMVWSPQWLGILGRFRIGKKRTFDASATPELGANAIEPRILESSDLAELRSAMASVVTEAESKDPKALQVKVRQLEKELQKVRADAPASDPEQLERARQEGHGAAVRELVGKISEREASAVGVLEAARDRAKGTLDLIDQALAGIREPIDVDLDLPATRVAPSADVRTRPLSVPAAAPPAGVVGGVRQRILDALAELAQVGIPEAPRSQVAIFSGYKNAKSSGFAKALSQLSSDGLVRYPGNGAVALTDSGQAAACGSEAPITEDQLHARIRSIFPGVHWRILEPLIAVGGGSVSREDVAKSAGYENVKSSGFAKALSQLSSLGLVEYPGPGFVRAADLLFL